MQNGFPFQPNQSGANTSVTAASTTSAANLALPATTGVSDTMRITVVGNQPVAWAFGNVSVTLTGGTLMGAGTSEVFTVPPATSVVSHIAQAAGSNISVSIGKGGV